MRQFLCLLMCFVLLTGCGSSRQENTKSSGDSYIDISEEITTMTEEVDPASTEVIDQVLLTLSNGCKLIQTPVGTKVVITVVGNAAKIEIGLSKIYLDNNHVYVVESDDKACKCLAEEFSKGEYGITADICIGSIKDIKDDVKEILKSLRNLSATKDPERYSVANEKGEGSILFSDGILSSIQIPYNSQYITTIEPCSDDIESEIKFLNAEEATIDNIKDMIDSAIRVGVLLSS